MPKKVWIDRILSFWESKVFRASKFKTNLPVGIYGEIELGLVLSRLSFSIVLWLSGLLVYALDGLLPLYVSDLQTIGFFLALAPLIFVGSGGLYYWLLWFFPYVRPMIVLSEKEFEEFSNKVERVAYSFLPYLLLAIVFYFSFANPFDEFELMLVDGLKLHAVWHLTSSFFAWLIIATGVWIVVSMWLAIFSFSRQPLTLELSQKTLDKFKVLSLSSLSFSLFYFLGVSISVFFPPPGASLAISPLRITIAIYSIFALVGVISAVFPFYNVHRVLVQLKQQELQKIEEAERTLLQELDNVLTKSETSTKRDYATLITARLIGLQVQERRIRDARDWPVDISFFSTLAGIVLIPILIELLTRIFLL